MKSMLILENYPRFIERVTQSREKRLVEAAVQYHIASRTGQPQDIRTGYERMLAQVRQGEQESGVQVLQSPDESYVCALTALASHIYQTWNQTRTVFFSSVEEANDWLWRNKGIVVTDMDIRAAVTPGLFANHTTATSISVVYRPHGGDANMFYAIHEEEDTWLFRRGKTENYAVEWEHAHPGCKSLIVRHYTNSRGDSTSLFFGFGLDYVEHIKHFVLYCAAVNRA